MANPANGLRTTLACVILLACGTGKAADNCGGHVVNIGARSVAVDHSVRAGDARQALSGACDAEGLCIRKDRDGDEQIAESGYVPGDPAPTWRVIGGTGKYARSAAAGWYKQALPDGDVLVYAWGGNCKATARRAPEVRMTAAEMKSTFTNVVIAGMCTDGTVFESRYGAEGLFAHVTRTTGGQVIFEDTDGRWFAQEEADGASMCMSWKPSGTSCWAHFRAQGRNISREKGAAGRTCWYKFTPD